MRNWLLKTSGKIPWPIEFVGLFFGISLAISSLVGCTGQQGPSGPAGSSGPTYFQAMFQDDVYPTTSYSGELDTWLNAAAAGTPMYASPYLEVNTGSSYTTYGRILLHFDVSSLPANVQVIDAEVWLKLDPSTSIGSSPVTIGAHNMASSTFSSCHWGAASWANYGGSSWATCTGDSSPQQEGYIDPAVLSTVTFNSSLNGTGSFYRWDIGSAVVQSWLANAVNNNGLIFKSEGEFGENTSSVDFYPYNDSTASNHALLIVRYQ